MAPAPSSRQFLLGSFAVLHALVLGAAAALLPWRFSWAVSLPAGLLAAGYGALALSSFAGTTRTFSLWKFVSIASLLVFACFTSLVVFWSVHLLELYGDIGLTVGVGLGVVLLALAVFLVPLPLSCLVVWHRSTSSRKLEASALLVLPLLLLPLVGGRRARADEPPTRSSSVALAEAVESAWVNAESTTTGGAKRSAQSNGAALAKPTHARLTQRRAAKCQRPPQQAKATWLLTYQGEDGQKVRCLQGENQEDMLRGLARLLKHEAASRSAVKIDMVVHSEAIEQTWPLLDALRLRPGPDGLCGDNRCWAPYQLVLKNAFTSYRPLPGVPDASFGVDLDRLQDKLSNQGTRARLTRISTRSLLAQPDAGSLPSSAKVLAERPGVRVLEYDSLGLTNAEVTSGALRSAIRSARDYIVRSQDRHGAYLYMYEPTREKKTRGRLVLPRHAGTTLALCEIGASNHRHRRAITRALRLQARFRRDVKDFSVLAQGRSAVRLGNSALPLIALLTCREQGLADASFDELAFRLGGFLLVMQRDDGSFHPRFDLKDERPRGENEALYAAGQAVYALVLLARLAEDSGLEQRAEEFRRATERAMDHYANSYWPAGLADLFYLEENWHCLAARAALTSHRHDAYERFCIDYVRFRLRLHEGDDAVLGQEGGYTISPLFPPHITPTAGTAEAGSAALAVAHQRGEHLPDVQRGLRRAVGYLLRHQLREQTCFFCKKPRYADGAFPENPVSRTVRIDYVQHSMAGMYHTGKQLFGDDFFLAARKPPR